MPRKNNRQRTNDRANFDSLTAALRDEWAVSTGRKTWAEIRADRKAAK